MARTFNVYDTENGRVVSVIKRVAESVKLTAAALTSGSAEVTVAATTSLLPGMLLVGKGITSGTTVLSVDTATTFTMSGNATANGTGLFVYALSYIPYKADGTLDTRDVNLEHYRDLFSDSTPMETLVAPGPLSGGSIDTKGFVMYPEAPVATAPSGGNAGNIMVTLSSLNVSVSDEKSHTAPRDQVQTCSFVHFVLEDGVLLPVLRLPTYDIVPVS